MVKLLAIGSVENNLSKVTRKIQKLIKKSGPFSLVLFVSSIGKLSDEKITISVPTYFCGQENDSNEIDSGNNLKSVGNASFLQMHELGIFFASGNASSDEIDKALKSVNIGEDFNGIDVLVTHALPDEDGKMEKCRQAAMLCKNLRPRYHLCAAETYQCDKPITFNGADHETRVVKIAPAAPQKGNEKWAYAADITPLSEVIKKRSHDNKEQTNQVKKKARQQSCWFCLAVAEQKHLVVAIGKNVYVALARGGLMNEHLLIIPVEHKICSNDINEEIVEEMKLYMNRINKYFKRKKNGCETFFFERGEQVEGLRHMLIQAIPIRKEVIGRVGDVMKEVGRRFDIEINVEKIEQEEIASCMKTIREQKWKDFFWSEMGQVGKTMINVEKGKSLPSNFGRMVAATSLGKLERIEWRKCIKSEVMETKIAEEVSIQLEEM